jgi:NADH-quinone oxidoreductase subunit A
MAAGKRKGYHPMESYIMIGFSIFLGSLFVGGAIITSKILAFRSPEGWRKVQPYECSEKPIGGARIRFKVAFYIFALLFLIFDIEALFLFPCMKIFKSVVEAQNGSISPVVLLTELTVFVFILFVGLIYAWRKGVLIWE